MTIFLLACMIDCQQKPSEQADRNTAPQTQAGTSSSPDIKFFRGVGVIKKIKPQDPSLMIDHEEIKGHMPAMTMEYYVKDKSLLDSIQPGDKVDFVIENNKGVEVISEIKKK
jgi:Cu(I)/Ag(I) efflux system periplasmic protein CusF